MKEADELINIMFRMILTYASISALLFLLNRIYDGILNEVHGRYGDDSQKSFDPPEKNSGKKAFLSKGIPDKKFRRKSARTKLCDKSQPISIHSDVMVRNKALPSKDNIDEYLDGNSQSLHCPLIKVKKGVPLDNIKSTNFENLSNRSKLVLEQQSDEEDHKVLSSSDALNRNVEGYQTVSKQQDCEKDLSFSLKEYLKNLAKSIFISQLHSKEQDDIKSFEDQPYHYNRYFYDKHIDESYFNPQLPSFKQRYNRKLNKARTSKDLIVENSSKQRLRCSSKQCRFLKHKSFEELNEGKIDKGQPSESFINNYQHESCSNSQSPAKKEDDEKLDEALPSNDYLFKSPNKTNTQYLFLKHKSFEELNEDKFNKEQPSESFLNNNQDESCSNSQSPAKKQDDEKLDEALPSNDYLSKSPNKTYNFNFRLVFKQRDKRMKSRKFASKIKGNEEDAEASMSTLLGEKLLTADVAFCSDEKEAILAAHSTVLVAKSKYFEDLLIKASETIRLEMELETNVPFSTFFNIIKWFYSEKIEFSNDYTALEVYQAARHFKIQQLIHECRNYIKTMQINEHNVFSNLQLSCAMKIVELRRRCIKYIEQNTLLVMKSTEFLKSPFNLVRKICQLQCLSLTSEVQILEALLRWVDAQPKLKKGAVESLRGAALKCVRFLSFSAEEFVDVASKHVDLFAPGESESIFMYLVDPTPGDLEKLPAWCNRSRRTLLSNPMIIGTRPLSMSPEVENIQFKLKTSDVGRDTSELTSVLVMNCMSGVHQVQSVKFSFQEIGNGECILEKLMLVVHVLPNKKAICCHKDKNLRLKNGEITLFFSNGITVYEGQVLKIDATVNISQSNFFQFDTWFPKRDFDCFFVSKPMKGRLYFISEVVYGPLVT